MLHSNHKLVHILTIDGTNINLYRFKTEVVSRYGIFYKKLEDKTLFFIPWHNISKLSYSDDTTN